MSKRKKARQALAGAAATRCPGNRGRNSIAQGPRPGKYLISPELYERVWRIIRDAEPVTVEATFEEQLSAYRVRSLWEQ